MPGGAGDTTRWRGRRMPHIRERRERTALRPSSADRDLPLPASMSATNVQTCEFTALSSVSRTDFMFCRDLRRISLLVR